MDHRIATVINFCSNEYPFLAHCIDHVKPFSEQIILCVCDHFFDGTPEDKNLLKAIYSEHPDCLFVEFEFDLEKNRCGPKNSKFWHNLARLLGLYFAGSEIEYILFIDCDEIFDGDEFIPWLNTFEYRRYEVMQLACYWYFRTERYRAATWEDTPLLVKKTSIVIDMLMDLLERGALYTQINGKKMRHVLGVKQKPMIHHYSWVRTKEQMLRKISSWGHHKEKDWASLVEEEFSRFFNGQEFVHGYELYEVQPFIKVNLNKKPPFHSGNEEQKNVRFINTDEIHKIDLSLRFKLCINPVI